MDCKQCGRLLDYVGGDCYACPVHHYDWMKTKKKKLSEIEVRK